MPYFVSNLKMIRKSRCKIPTPRVKYGCKITTRAPGGYGRQRFERRIISRDTRNRVPKSTIFVKCFKLDFSDLAMIVRNQ